MNQPSDSKEIDGFPPKPPRLLGQVREAIRRLHYSRLMRIRFAAIAHVALLALLAAPAHPQETFPVRPLRFVVGFAAGGGNDIMVRVLSGKLAESLGQPVIVENKPGAQSIIAVE